MASCSRIYKKDKAFTHLSNGKRILLFLLRTGNTTSLISACIKEDNLYYYVHSHLWLSQAVITCRHIRASDCRLLVLMRRTGERCCNAYSSSDRHFQCRFKRIKRNYYIHFFCWIFWIPFSHLARPFHSDLLPGDTEIKSRGKGGLMASGSEQI